MAPKPQSPVIERSCGRVRRAMTEAVQRGSGGLDSDLGIIRWLDHHYLDDLCDPLALEAGGWKRRHLRATVIR